jgi:hypothetical protein
MSSKFDSSFCEGLARDLLHRHGPEVASRLAIEASREGAPTPCGTLEPDRGCRRAFVAANRAVELRRYSMQKLDRAFHERVALDLLARDGLRVVWKLHLDAANAYRGGYPRGAQILIETADAAERLIRHAAKIELARHTE